MWRGLVRSRRMPLPSPLRGVCNASQRFPGTNSAAWIQSLASQPVDAAVILDRCLVCGSISSSMKVCGGCHCIAICSPECQAKIDRVHTIKECNDHARYLKTDVRVRFDGMEPQWLSTAMDHRCDQSSLCEVLEAIGTHDSAAYQLLCGCTSPPSPHRHLVDPVPLSPDFVRGAAAPLSSWSEYHDVRGLPREDPISILLSFPLTVYHMLMVSNLLRKSGTSFVSESHPLRVHLLGPEKELHLLPLFRELAVLLPHIPLEISMVGPVACDLPREPVRFSAGSGSVTVTCHAGWYHTVDHSALGGTPDVVIALNAGLAASGYNWGDTLSLISRGPTPVPFFFTDYSEYSAEKAAARAQEHGLQLTVPVSLNPFRAPLRQPRVMGGSVGFPWLSNGWMAGFNTTPSTG